MDQKELWAKMYAIAEVNPDLTIDEVAAKVGLDFTITIMPVPEPSN